MKRLMLLIVLLTSAVLFGKYNVGDVCADLSWTDSDGLTTSIYEQTAAGKAVMIFWGSDG